MARSQPAPEGYEVVKVRGGWVVLITPRDASGRMTRFGYIADVEGDHRLPLVFRRRAQAITTAAFHGLEEENARLRARLAGGVRHGVGSDLRAAGVS